MSFQCKSCDRNFDSTNSLVKHSLIHVRKTNTEEDANEEIDKNGNEEKDQRNLDVSFEVDKDENNSKRFKCKHCHEEFEGIFHLVIHCQQSHSILEQNDMTEKSIEKKEDLKFENEHVESGPNEIICVSDDDIQEIPDLVSIKDIPESKKDSNENDTKIIEVNKNSNKEIDSQNVESPSVTQDSDESLVQVSSQDSNKQSIRCQQSDDLTKNSTTIQSVQTIMIPWNGKGENINNFREKLQKTNDKTIDCIQID